MSQQSVHLSRAVQLIERLAQGSSGIQRAAQAEPSKLPPETRWVALLEGKPHREFVVVDVPPRETNDHRLVIESRFYGTPSPGVHYGRFVVEPAVAVLAFERFMVRGEDWDPVAWSYELGLPWG